MTRSGKEDPTRSGETRGVGTINITVLTWVKLAKLASTALSRADKTPPFSVAYTLAPSFSTHIRLLLVLVRNQGLRGDDGVNYHERPDSYRSLFTGVCFGCTNWAFLSRKPRIYLGISSLLLSSFTKPGWSKVRCGIEIPRTRRWEQSDARCNFRRV